jgi:streptomycin 6-kinase
MRRLMSRFGLDEADLFHTPAERLQEALSRQEHRIAYISEEFRLDGTRG